MSTVEAQTVVVVEDDGALRELARKLLERQGYTVLTAADANEAVRLFEANPAIDVLLTDVVMPGASGPELTRRLTDGWQRWLLQAVPREASVSDRAVCRRETDPSLRSAVGCRHAVSRQASVSERAVRRREADPSLRSG